LISYEPAGGGRAAGVWMRGRVAPVAASMIELITEWDDRAAEVSTTAARLEAGEVLDGSQDFSAVRLLPPVPDPPKILCVARNYEAHAAETNREIPSHPSIFLRLSRTLVAADYPILVPPVSERVDWEGELAVVIGKPGRLIDAASAFDHVFGYSIFNDVSVRDYQMHTAQFTPGKNFDGSGPFGPALMTADEIGDPGDLTIRTLVNGAVKQETKSGEMVFSIPELISYCSEFTTLEPGDVIATGTPAGVGVARQPPEFLRPGDVCSIEIDKLGVLTNPVAAG
jgi:2-keto-4-pentenoate hydratase/2-oxohepta-3-ene-1,7-dioic acid hydratase in catechol pathway